MAAQKTILAVDDESDVLLLLKTALMSEGFVVMTATNGHDAISMARETTPNLIILDLMMPELSGFETLKQLRDGSATQLVPVIMLTGVSDKGKIREAIDLGINYYLVKPFEFHDLVAKVKLAIQDSDAQPA
jgi:two-component system, OmpR family, response regulator MprA